MGNSKFDIGPALPTFSEPNHAGINSVKVCLLGKHGTVRLGLARFEFKSLQAHKTWRVQHSCFIPPPPQKKWASLKKDINKEENGAHITLKCCMQYETRKRPCNLLKRFVSAYIFHCQAYDCMRNTKALIIVINPCMYK